MSEVFISYVRASEPQALRVADALRDLGYGVWRDDELPAHRAYGEVIEERLRAAKAVVVLWSTDAVKSHWVRAEADVARKAGTLVQLSLDGALPPLPFDQVHCVNLDGWTGDTGASGWRKISESVGELLGRDPASSGPGPPPLPDRPSIAVLPFANLSKEADQDYFVEGMMDEIVTALTRIHSLFVIGSASSLSLKGQDIAASEAARRLGVRYILEGSVRRAGPRVRISVKLTDARGGDQIWAERFEDTLDDVFALQDHVALSVAGVIEPTVQAAELRRIVRRPLESLGCYDLYLRAASLRVTLRKAEVLQALELLERALALDADFAPALAQAAGCHSQVYVNNWSDDREAHRRRGIEMAERAVAAGADDAAVLTQVANALAELDPDPDRAAALAERAVRLNPGSAYGWFISGIIRLLHGELDTAIEELQTAARLDPISRLGDMARAHVAVALAGGGRFEDAERAFRGTTYRTPRIHLMRVALYGHLGRLPEAQEELELYAGSTSVPIATMARFATRYGGMAAILIEGLRLANVPTQS